MSETASGFLEGEARTFRASTPRDAIEAVKRAFGSSAVILSSREVPGGLFRPPEVEIVAAPERAVPALPQTEAQRQLRSSAAARAHERLRRAAAMPPPEERSEEPLEEEPVRQEPTRKATARKPAERKATGRRGPPPRGRAELVARLVSRGVDEGLAVEVVESSLAAPGAARDPERALAEVVRESAATLPAPWAAADRRRVIALVGPTGVGKTTTIAKIAARSLTAGAAPPRIALISLDNWRIGAVEQIGRYAEIMGLPAHVVSDHQQLATALTHHDDADLVLVDTAGRSPSDRDALARQADLLAAIPDVEVYFAVPASTSEAQLAFLLDRMSAVPLQGLVVTKLDEAIGPGRVLSVALRSSLPLVLVTDGQRVPEDLHDVTGENLGRWTLG
jgi:flagellar biosynthesis protein FlhF